MQKVLQHDRSRSALAAVPNTGCRDHPVVSVTRVPARCTGLKCVPESFNLASPLSEEQRIAFGPLQAVPGDPDLWVVSDVDARLEALQNTLGRQIWFGPATNGIVQLKPGDTVLDIGANVGSFARLAARVVGPSGRVIAVEPLPEVFEALQQNAQLWNSQQLDSSTSMPQRAGTAMTHDSSMGATSTAAPVGSIIPKHCGILEDLHLTTAEFTYYPRCTAFSTLAALRDDEDALAATISIVQHDPAPPTSLLQRCARMAARALPYMYAPVHKLMFQSLFLSNARSVPCPVTTVSRLMEDLQFRRVDLLKINVERGELGVLRSVTTPADWLKIEQVSMQLHDREGALDQAVSILRGPGQFDVVQHFCEPRFSGCCLVQVVAKRSKQIGLQ